MMQMITVVPILPVEALTVLPAPAISQVAVNTSTSVNLSLATLPNILYRLEIATNNNTAFQLAQTLYNTSTAVVNNLRPEDNYYCFRLGAFDPCNNTTVYSSTICSTNFDVAAQNNQNALSWVTNVTGITNFSISRDGVPLGTTASASFMDNNVVCKTTYCYQLTSNYANGSSSVSLVQCETAFSSDIPTSVNNISAQVNTTGVELTWLRDPAFQAVEYNIFRKTGTDPLQLFAKSTTTQYFDNTYTTEGEYCYQINYEDLCDNIALVGIEACPIRLNGTITSENYSSLTWSEYTGWANGVNQYVLEKYNATGQLLQIINFGPAIFSFIDTDVNPTEQVFRYIVLATPNQAGLDVAISNELELVKEVTIFYPLPLLPIGRTSRNEIFKVFDNT